MVVLMLSVCSTAQAQIPGLGRGKDNKDDAKLRESQKAKAEKDAKRYDKLKAFSLNLYQSDADFHDVQRQHSDYAFRLNYAPPARPTPVHDGDRLRLQPGLYDNKLVSD